MFALLIGHEKELWSAATVLLGFLLNRFFRLKPRLLYSVGHSFNFLVEQPLRDTEGKEISPTQIVRTASITVQNDGLQAAKGVEITFNWKPPVLNVWPARRFEESVGAFNRYSLKLDSLAPKETFSLEIMAINGELPMMTSVRCEDCEGKLISMSPQRVWPSSALIIFAALMILGGATAIYLVLTGIQTIAQF